MQNLVYVEKMLKSQIKNTFIQFILGIDIRIKFKSRRLSSIEFAINRKPKRQFYV